MQISQGSAETDLRSGGRFRFQLPLQFIVFSNATAKEYYNWSTSAKVNIKSCIFLCETGNSIASIWTSYLFIKMAAAAARYYIRFRIC